MTESFTELLITLFSSAGLAGALFAALVAFVQGRCGEAELKTARDEYSSFLEKSRALKAKLAAEHTEH